jgi:hypothetical protein
MLNARPNQLSFPPSYDRGPLPVNSSLHSVLMHGHTEPLNRNPPTPIPMHIHSSGMNQSPTQAVMQHMPHQQPQHQQYIPSGTYSICVSSRSFLRYFVAYFCF